ncbi:hypothetical protein CC80DRAFT_531839 [Byssothecium circinans]|uniref:Uncharacterized protein n=1 Tax=Byssothecium circinans TaxID=147558 RepID=A0A6A5UJ63_9PLEO|nr:hypothetical protein CC80DRAFT_531839 [Byssothecium circinans]
MDANQPWTSDSGFRDNERQCVVEIVIESGSKLRRLTTIDLRREFAAAQLTAAVPRKKTSSQRLHMDVNRQARGYGRTQTSLGFPNQLFNRPVLLRAAQKQFRPSAVPFPEMLVKRHEVPRSATNGPRIQLNGHLRAFIHVSVTIIQGKHLFSR